MPRVAHAYPLMLDVTNRLVVIVGGGGVAVRKARGLLVAGAMRIRVVSPECHPEMPAEVERVAAPFRPEHLDGAELVFAATDSPGVNEQVVIECRRRRILVNRADVDEENPGDFTTPAIHRTCDLIVTVSAGGNPALAARIRDDLAGKLDPVAVQMTEVMQTLRPMVRDNPRLSEARRRAALRDLAGDESLKLLGGGGLPMLMAWLKQRYPEIEGNDK